MDTATQTFRFGHASDADWETLTASCLDQIGDVPEGPQSVGKIACVYLRAPSITVGDEVECLHVIAADRRRVDIGRTLGGATSWIAAFGSRRPRLN